MGSRMDKYNSTSDIPKRSERNQELYKQIYNAYDEFENFMLPLTVSFETVLQIFNNNFKQEDVKVGLFPNMRKGDFVHSRTKPRCKLRTRAAGLCAPCLISPHFPITCL